jgi:PAS domain S-box-containing protein
MSSKKSSLPLRPCPKKTFILGFLCTFAIITSFAILIHLPQLSIGEVAESLLGSLLTCLFLLLFFKNWIDPDQSASTAPQEEIQPVKEESAPPPLPDKPKDDPSEIWESLKLLERLRLTQFAVDRSIDAVYWIQKDGRFIYVNNAACKSLGFSREELLTMRVSDIDPDFPQENWPAHWVELRQRGAMIIRSHHRKKDGRIFPVEIAINYSEFDGVGYNCAFARDLTAQVRSEEALRESEERYRNLIEQMPDAIYRSTPEGRFVAVNEAFVKMLGYDSKEEMMKLYIPRDLYFSPEDRDAINIPLAEKDEPETTLIRLKKKDGSEVFVEDHGQTICDDDGQLLYYEGVLRNITDRMQAEEALREKEELLKETIESTMDGILVVNQRGEATHFNKRFAVMWRIPDELLYKKDDNELLAFVLDQLVDPRAFLLKVQKLYQSSAEDKDLLLFKDGRVFERYSRPLMRQGKVAGRVWNFRDITQQKQSENALRESEEKYKSIVENSNELIMLTLADGKVSYLSPACKDVLGYEPEALIGKQPWIFHEDDMERVKEIHYEALKGHSGSGYEYRIVTPMGETRWVSHSWSPVFSDRKLKMIVSVVRNIVKNQPKHSLEEKIEKKKLHTTS